MQPLQQIHEDYRGNGRQEGVELKVIDSTVLPKDDEKSAKLVKTVELVGEDSLRQLISTEAPEKFGINGKPLQVKEALAFILEKVKQDPDFLEQVTKNVEDSKEDTQTAQEYRQLVLAMLKEDDTTTRKRIEAMDKWEKDWVFLKDDGVEPEFPPYIYEPPTWGTTAWNATKKSGSAAWTVGKFSGKVGYRVYVESARIGTIALLGFMVVENPLFPILQMVVKHVVLK